MNRSGFLLLLLILSAGCRVDPLRSKSHIRDRAAWLTMKRVEMRGEAHRLDLGTLYVALVRGETSLSGLWQSPNAQLQIDQQERRSLRTSLVGLYGKWGFQTVDRNEDETRQIEHAAKAFGSRPISSEGYIGRSVGAEIVATITLDIIREAYFVPYMGWKTRSWTIWVERYWNARDDRLLASSVWDGRQRKALTKGIRRGHLFQGLLIDVATQRATPDEKTKMSEHYAAIQPIDVSWHYNYFLAGWFGRGGAGFSFPGSNNLSLIHYRLLAERVPGGGFLKNFAQSKIAELQGDRARAGELALEAAKSLPRSSAFLGPQLERTSNLLGISRSEINLRLGLVQPSGSVKDRPASGLEEVDKAVAYLLCELAGGDKVMGSSFMISADGLLLTSAHVIQNAKEISVKYWDGVWGTAEVVAVNSAYDLALLRVVRRDLPVVQLANGERAAKGSTIYVIGNPEGLEHTVTRGIVSGYHTLDKAVLIQTDAAINPGNSGGPMIDEEGRLLGIATYHLREREGLNFGVATETVRDFVKGYIK